MYQRPYPKTSCAVTGGTIHASCSIAGLGAWCALGLDVGVRGLRRRATVRVTAATHWSFLRGLFPLRDAGADLYD
jgi:hypothetical protein